MADLRCVVMRHLMSSPDLASTHQYRMFITWWPWRSLSSWCITGPAQLGVLRMQGWMCLLGNILYEDILPCQTVIHQHMKCTTSRAGRTWSLSTINLPNTKQSVLPIGDRSWLDHDRWSVADILNHTSTDWRDFQHQIMCGCKTNVNDTNAIALVWLALHCVSADVKARCSWAPFKLYDRDSILIYEKQFEPFDNHGNLWSHYVSVTMLWTFT